MGIIREIVAEVNFGQFLGELAVSAHCQLTGVELRGVSAWSKGRGRYQFKTVITLPDPNEQGLQFPGKKDDSVRSMTIAEVFSVLHEFNDPGYYAFVTAGDGYTQLWYLLVENGFKKNLSHTAPRKTQPEMFVYTNSPSLQDLSLAGIT